MDARTTTGCCYGKSWNRSRINAKNSSKKGEPKPSSAKKSMTILVYQKTIFASKGRQKAMGLTEQEIIRLAAEQAAKVAQW